MWFSLTDPLTSIYGLLWITWFLLVSTVSFVWLRCWLSPCCWGWLSSGNQWGSSQGCGWALSTESLFGFSLIADINLLVQYNSLNWLSSWKLLNLPVCGLVFLVNDEPWVLQYPNVITLWFCIGFTWLWADMNWMVPTWAMRGAHGCGLYSGGLSLWYSHDPEKPWRHSSVSYPNCAVEGQYLLAHLSSQLWEL